MDSRAPSEALESERESLKQTILVTRLSQALKRLNPWLSADNVNKTVREVTHVQAASLLDASSFVYNKIAYDTTRTQDLGIGTKGQRVRFFDFDKPSNNDFIVTRQFRLQGVKKQIVPDIVVFINGLPLAIIECKSPTLGQKWRDEAIEQLHRYQELTDDYKELGMPRLFETAQILVGTCGQGACFGTVTTR